MSTLSRFSSGRGAGRWRRRAAVLAGAALVLFGLGFAWFAGLVDEPGVPPPHADGIVALTGGAERIETALHLLDEGRAGLLLVSGVAHGAALHELTGRVGMDPAALAARITLGRQATSTFGNAAETAGWVAQHGIHSLIVVTANYHMPRALLELRRALPGVALYPAAVQPAGLSGEGKLRLLISEYVRLLAAGCGLSRMLHGVRPG